jgi:hypothetical protein
MRHPSICKTLALTSPMSAGRSVSIVRSLTKATEFCYYLILCFFFHLFLFYDCFFLSLVFMFPALFFSSYLPSYPPLCVYRLLLNPLAFLVAASIFPSPTTYWTNPSANLYSNIAAASSHSMTHHPSHVTSHLGSYPHYA